LVLQSDPRFEPGAFGPGWHLPFFRSTFLQVKDHEAIWEMPNGRRMFFPRDRLAEEGDEGVRHFRSREGDWTALWEQDRDEVEVTVTSTEDPETWFHYDGGRLESFRMGSEVPEYQVDWLGGSRYPRMIRPANQREGPVEIIYAGRTPEAIRVGERVWEVELGSGDWTAPDGRSDYADYRVQFLTELKDSQGNTERFAYKKADPHERSVPTEEKSTSQRMATIPVNRLGILAEGETERGFLAWEARSGFLVKDSGGEYTVSSKGQDPEHPGYQEGRSRGDVAPDAVRIERQPEKGSPELWSYNYRTGLKERTDASTGERIRESFIVSPGPAYGKLRRRERQPEGSDQWELVEHRAYDTEGRLLRSIESGVVRNFVWEERGEFSRSQEFVDGVLTKERVYEDGQRVRMTEWDGGEENSFVYTLEGGSETIHRHIEGEWESTQVWQAGGKLLYAKYRDGLETIIRYGEDGVKETLHYRPSGTSVLIRHGEKGREMLTGGEEIGAWASDHQPMIEGLRKNLGL